MAHPTTLICMRLADMRNQHPKMTTALCAQCRDVVGIYPSGQKILERYPTTLIKCQICEPPSPTSVLAPGAIQESFESTRRH